MTDAPNTQTDAGRAGAGPMSFFTRLPGVFVYPFVGHGWAMILMGAVVFSFMEVLTRLWIFAIILGPIIVGYISAFMIKVLGASAGGEDAPPDWPDMSNFWDDIFKPLLLLAEAGLISFLPLILYKQDFARDSLGPERPEVIWALVGWGALYLPMGMVAVALYESFAALNPVLILRGIVVTMPAYLPAVAMFLVCYVLGVAAVIWVTEWVPLIGPLVAWTICLYFVMVEMRILGLLYRTHARRLGWFEWDDDRTAPEEAAAE